MIKNCHGSGTSNPNAKLTNEKANQMRQLHKTYPELDMQMLGQNFGVGRETARKVIKGILWL